MRLLSPLLALGVLATGARAQLPVDFARVELARSRNCVSVLERVEALNARLAPLAERSQRLMAIGDWVALEEREWVDSLRTSDPVEAAVRAWFDADAEIARRYVANPSQILQDQRTLAKDSIKVRLVDALEEVQTSADSIIAETGTLSEESSQCSGAVFIRPAVIETCGSATSSMCQAARDSTSRTGPYRFVESPDVLWGLQELRTWTAPTPLQVVQGGQLGGARTVGFTRAANVVVTVAFGARIRRRAELTVSESTRALALADSLGFGAGHPDLVFGPSLAIQATLPEALGGETRYVLHFGLPDAADILWAANAGTGAAIEGIVELGPGRLEQLRSGEPLTLTALRPTESGANEPVYSIELTAINQGTATDALVQYMASQLTADLAQLFPPAAASDSASPR